MKTKRTNTKELDVGQNYELFSKSFVHFWTAVKSVMLEMVLLINEYVSAADVIDVFKNMKLLVIEVFLFVNECYLSNVFFLWGEHNCTFC